MTAGVWKTMGAVIFLAILFFDIVFCVMHIPKKDLGNRPSDFGSAKDDSGQKAEQSNNNIQNIHSGFPPLGISCRNIRTVRRTTEIELPPDLTSGGSMTAALAGQRLSTDKNTIKTDKKQRRANDTRAALEAEFKKVIQTAVLWRLTIRTRLSIIKIRKGAIRANG